MAKKKRMVIIGAGAAGLSAIDAIREVDKESPLTVISGEKGLPYARMSIPYYIMDKISLRTLFPRNKEYFKQQNIQPLFGECVVEVNPQQHKVLLSGGSSLEYDRLLIATGSSPEVREVAGFDLPGVLNMWTLQDALNIRQLARRAESVAIWGAGMIAFLAAKALAGPGRKVYIVCRAGHLFRRALDAEAAGLMEKALTKKGVVCLKETNILEIMPWGKGRKRLRLSDGSDLIVDLVIKGLGVKPNLDFLAPTGVLKGPGIEVNECMETEIEGIYAAGDIAVVPDCVTGDKVMPALWTSAVLEGRAAGLNMAGYRYHCERALAMNIMDLEGYSTVSIGCPLATEGVEVHQFRLPAEGKYRRLVFQGNRLIGVILVGETADAGIFPVLIRRRFNLSSWKKRMILNPWNMAGIFSGLPALEKKGEFIWPH